jgi:hypothetical protein
LDRGVLGILATEESSRCRAAQWEIQGLRKLKAEGLGKVKFCRIAPKRVVANLL